MAEAVARDMTYVDQTFVGEIKGLFNYYVNCTIQSGVFNACVFERCTIGEDAKLIGCTFNDGCVVGNRCSFDNCWVSDDLKMGADCKTVDHKIVSVIDGRPVLRVENSSGRLEAALERARLAKMLDRLVTPMSVKF